MNHVYRLIWNTSLGCWMVASEHTRSHGKRSSTTRGLVAAVVLALSMPVAAADALGAPAEDAVEVLDESDDRMQSTAPLTVHKEQIALFGNALPRSSATNAAPLAFNRYLQATVNDTYFANATLNGENSLVLGSRARVTGNRSTGIGNEVVVSGGGHTVVGSKASATGRDAVAIGINALAAGTGNVSIGEAARAETGPGIHAVAIGALARAGSPGWTGAVAVGGETTATQDAVALGYKANAQNYGAMSLGRESVGHGIGALAVGRYAKAQAEGAIAIGSGAQAPFQYGIAVGAGAQSQAAWGTALGADAMVGAGANQAVALGAGSVATAANTVSVGSASLKRKLVNLADGEVSATSTDAVNGKQLHAVANRLDGPNIVIGQGAASAGERAVVIGQEGHVYSGSKDAIAIGTKAKAGAQDSTGGIAIGASSTSSYNGMALGYNAHASALDSVALGAGSTATESYTVSVGSAARKRRIVNVADGALSTGSTEAVTGKQLFATNQNVTTAIDTANTAKTTADAAKVDAANALDKATVVSGLIGQVSASGNVRVGGENTGTVLDVRNKTNANRKISGVADGEVSATSTEAVTGKQLHAITGSFTGQKVVLGENAQAIGGRAIAIGASSTVNTGGGNDGIAIGGHSRAGTPGYGGAVAIGGFATADADGLALGYDARASAGQAVALGRGSVANVANTVSVGSDTIKRKIVNVADGALSATSTEAVTGKQLFATNQNVTTATNIANTAKTTADAAKVDAANALDKATVVSGLIGQVSASGNVRVGGENTGTVLDVRNKANANRTVSGVADGALSATSTDAVTGKQLLATNQLVTANGVAIADNRRDIGVNRDDLDTLRDDFDNYTPDLSGVVQYNADRTLVDLGGAGVTGLADGEISATSTHAVNGSQLFGTNERVEYLEQQQRYVMVGVDESSLPAQAGNLGVAVGGDADAREEGATAVGSFATAKGRNSVALGRAAYVAPEGRDGFALGTRTRVQAVGGLAIGADSDVIAGADQSVALGNASVAKEANTVAVGNDGLKRRIVHVARGTNDDNATSLVQLRETLAALGGGAAIDVTGQVIAPNYMLSAGSFNNVGDALTSLDTTLISHKSDLDTLDSRYQSLVQNDRSIRYNEDRSVVDFGGATVTGVAAGTLSADSSDAVNGAQLFGTNQRVDKLEYKHQYISIGNADPSGPATSGFAGVAVGDSSRALGDGATAVGSHASAMAESSVALGRGSYVAPGSDYGFALGTLTGVRAHSGMAIGSSSVVLEGAYRSIALGVSSVATQADTVSIGNDNLKRRIVNVGQGIQSNDATNVAQLRGALDALGGGAGLDANGNVIGPRYAVQGSEYGSFGDAITALDGSVGDNKRTLDTLDSRFQRLFQESLSASSDAPGRLTLGGGQGMVLGNVANGLIGQGSRDAVNGGQLWAVKQDLQGQIDALDPNGQGATPLAMNARSAAVASDTTTPPAADAGTPSAAPDAVVTAEGDNAVAVGSEGKERAVKHVAEGRADTDAANVRQVNDALERANAYTDSAVASVNQRLDQVDKRINRMAAISSAQSAMAMNTAGLATANRLGAGVGYSEGESAMAVGYQRVLTERGSATFSLNGAFTNSGEKSVGVGVGIGW